MKTFISLLILIVISNAGAATGRKWNPSGSGSWKDDERWIFYEADSDRILIKGCTATMTEEDFEFLSGRSDLIFEDDAVLEVTVSKDATFPVTPISAASKGKIVKKGSGRLSIGDTAKKTKTRYQLPDKGVQVDEGDLLCLCCMGPITVDNPGRLIPRTDGDFYCHGLWGDGKVVNESEYKFVFIGNDFSNIPDFKGSFPNKVNITIEAGCCQYLSNPQMTSQDGEFVIGDNRGTSGMFGIASFGYGEDASTLGINNTVFMWGVALRYLGNGGESTDKELRIVGGSPAIDGGKNGGVEFLGPFSCSYTSKMMGRLTLCGSNTVAACVMKGAMKESEVHSTYLIKDGPGKWELANTSLGHHGVTAIKEGTLGFVSMEAAGVDSSLGYSDRLYCDHVGVKNENPDPSKAVAYAFLLGNGMSFDPQALNASTATFEYRGTTPLVCDTRLLALDGAGRFAGASSATIDFSGVTSATDKDHALVLAADNAGNVMRNVTNGIGRITIVKEGSGDWTLREELDFSGIEVRGGDLKIDNPSAFEYFRFSAKENYEDIDGDKAFHLAEFAMWDSENNMRTANLAYRDCVGDATALLPGEVTDLNVFTVTGGEPNQYAPRGRTVENLFTNDVAITVSVRNTYDIIWSGNVKGKKAVLDDPSSWSGFIFRLPGGSPVVRYDMRDTGGFKKGGFRELKSWTLEGSVDGIVWHMIDNVISNEFDSSVSWQWRSTGQNAHSAGDGYPIDVTSPYKSPSAPISLRVDNGASLSAASAVKVNRLVYDVSSGAGEISGVDFASEGVINVTGDVEDVESIVASYGFSSCNNVDNISSWEIRVNGDVRSDLRARASSSGVTISPWRRNFIIVR